MADMPNAEGSLNEGITRTRSSYSELSWVATARTAPRAPHESRIGTDEAHERLQAARYRALRSAHQQKNE